MLALGVAALVAPVSLAARSDSLRGATAMERLQITQAMFDYYFSNSALSRAEAATIRVLPLRPAGAVGSRLVSKYAVIDVKGWDRSGQFVGNELAFAVAYDKPWPGWRILDDGTENVGCSQSFYPVGQKRTIVAQLHLRCVP
jgi:hypothetical protein